MNGPIMVEVADWASEYLELLQAVENRRAATFGAELEQELSRYGIQDDGIAFATLTSCGKCSPTPRSSSQPAEGRIAERPSSPPSRRAWKNATSRESRFLTSPWASETERTFAPCGCSTA